MGRYSPSVLPVATNPLATALGAFGDSYIDEREKRRQRMIEEALNASKGIYGPGVEVPKAPDRKPFQIPGLTPAPVSTPTSAPTGTSPALAMRGMGGVSPGQSLFDQYDARAAGFADKTMRSGDVDAVRDKAGYVDPSDLDPTDPKDKAKLADVLASIGPRVAQPQAQPKPGEWTPTTGFNGLSNDFQFGARTPPERYIRLKSGYTVQNPDYTAWEAQQNEMERLGVQEAMKEAEEARKRHDAFMQLHTLDPVKYATEQPGQPYELALSDESIRGRERETQQRNEEAARNEIKAAYSDEEFKRIGFDKSVLDQPFDPKNPTKFTALAAALDKRLGRSQQQDFTEQGRTEKVRADAMGLEQAVAAVAPEAVKKEFNLGPESSKQDAEKAYTYYKAILPWTEKAQKLGLGGMSGGAMAAGAYGRFSAAVPVLGDVHERMTKFEARMQSDPKLRTAWTEFLSQMQAKGGEFASHTSLTQTVEGVLAKSQLAKEFPGFRDYAIDAMRWAYEDGTLQLRGGTDFRVSMDAIISAAQLGQDAQGVKNAQDSRRERLAGYIGTYNAAFKALGRPKTPTDTARLMKMLHAAGYSDADAGAFAKAGDWPLPKSGGAGGGPGGGQ